MAYHAPADLSEALELMGEHGAGVELVAGGTDWYPARGRAPGPGTVLDLTRLRALRGIDREGDGWRIGAACTWTEIARAGLPPAMDGLREAARTVGGAQIQNAGTVAGNICNASPAADGVPPLLTLDAEVELASRDGARRMALEAFVTGPRATALRPGEMVVAIHLPEPPEGARGAFEKLGARRYLVISIAMTALVARLGPDGLVDAARVAVGACAPAARRLRALEADMIGARPGEVRVEPRHLEPLSPIGDVRADAAFRLAAVPRQIERALARACGG